jgi:type II secretory pathway pseudopilin PulG
MQGVKELSMSVSKKHFIRHYTIIEVMMAMGIFLVMMTIMMQFFTSAQQIWNKSSKRNAIYADARVAMNLMTREIQCMLYKNSEVDSTNKYPFWYEAVQLNDLYPSPISSDNTTLRDDLNLDYFTRLNFISATDLKPYDQGSDICEISYSFEPMYFDGAVSISNVKGGNLLRSCVGEYQKDGTLNASNVYDYASCYYRGITPVGTNPDTGEAFNLRIRDIWEDRPGFDKVISGVYSLRFSVFLWGKNAADPTETLKFVKPMFNDGSFHTSAVGFDLSGNLATGSPAPVAIRIDMKLLDPEDLKKFAVAIAKSDSKQIALYRRKIRTFSKVIYLGKLEN